MKTEDIYHYIQNLTDEVKEGNRKAVEARYLLSDIEKGAKKANEDIRPLAVKEVEQGNNTWNGYRVEKMQGGSWDYKNNPEWLKKKEELEAIQEIMKRAYRECCNNINAHVTDEGVELEVNGTKIFVIPADYTPNSETIKFTKLK